MLNLPASAAFERRIPKQKFYANLTVTPELRRCFTEQIEIITWADKLAPQTMNLAAGQRVQEIEVFRIRLAGDARDGKVTELMDKQIPYHILFVLTRPDGMLRLLMNYKEAALGGGFTLRQRCATGWLAPGTVCLPLLAADMDALYEGFVRYIAGDSLQSAAGEDLAQSVQRTEVLNQLQRQIDQLTAKMKREKQLPRQMELQRQIKKLQQEIEQWTK